MSNLKPGDRVIVLDPRDIFGKDADDEIRYLIGNEYVIDHSVRDIYYKLKDCPCRFGINAKLLERVEWAPDESPIDDESVLSLLIV